MATALEADLGQTQILRPDPGGGAEECGSPGEALHPLQRSCPAVGRWEAAWPPHTVMDSKTPFPPRLKAVGLRSFLK